MVSVARRRPRKTEEVARRPEQALVPLTTEINGDLELVEANSNLLWPRQIEVMKILATPARHICLVGGSRSGKTALLVRAIIIRALRARSRHAILRFRRNAVWPSIGMDTFPKVMRTFFPGVRYTVNKTLHYFEFENGSQVWLGGLDDKERTEKILGNEYCVDPESKVLTADLRWVPAKQLEVGQELIGFEEDLDNHMVLRRSVVERSETIKADKYRITTDKGTTVVSAQHKFVAYYDDRRHKNYRSLSWCMAQDLKVGDAIRYACKPWEVATDYQAGWMAGVYDGEGWVSGGSLGVAQNEGEVLEHIQRVLSSKDIDYRLHNSGNCSHAVARGLWASLKSLGVFRPRRLMPKSSELWEGRRGFMGRGQPTGRATGKDLKRNGAHCATILKIEKLGRGDVVSMSTSSKTFIADGFPGHNCTVYFNECSQIPYASVLLVLSRLAEEVPGLQQRAYYDLNPSSTAHWSNILFGQKKDPVSKRPLTDPDNYAREFLNPRDNPSLSPEYLASLDAMPERYRKRFRDGVYVDESDDALWKLTTLARTRVYSDEVPELKRIVVAVDPSGAKNAFDTGHDDIGLMVVGVGTDDHGYVLMDKTFLAGPEEWARMAVFLFHSFKADLIVAEINYGGAMVEATIRTADQSVPVKVVTASRGKTVRAEPVAALYEQGRVHHVEKRNPEDQYGMDAEDCFIKLEDELTNFTVDGYQGTNSPNRADALVWAVSELMLEANASGYLEFYRRLSEGIVTKLEAPIRSLSEALRYGTPANPIPPPAPVSVLLTQPHAAYYLSSPDGRSKQVVADGEGIIRTTDEAQIKALLNAGCIQQIEVVELVPAQGE